MLMNSHLKKVYKEKQVDPETGEVISEKNFNIVVDSKDQFILIYCKLLLLYKDMRGADIKVLAGILLQSNWDTNSIILNKATKTIIAESMGLSYNTVHNSVYSLSDQNILIKDTNYARGALYYVHPDYAWKGERSKQRARLKFVLELIKKNNG